MAETEFKQLARPQRQLQWAGVKKYTYILLHTHIIHYYHIYFVEPPFGLRLLLPFWCRRGVVLVHGWCAEKENRGKAGSRQGKIGVGVGSCRSMDPVGIQSGCSPATLLATRDPVGHQYWNFWHRFWTVGKQLKSPQNVPKPSKDAFF